MNKAVCYAALTLLSLSFLPGTLVQLAQIVTRRAYIPLGARMTLFMDCRKALGLMAAWLSLVHAIMSVLMISKPYYGKFFNAAGIMNLGGEVSMLLGIVAFAL
jgi:DMSO/TMAO reductase YedYZ heme-binding membrane subunit